MRHGVVTNKLSRTGAHRKALFKNLAASLFRHGRIVTTLEKAKAVRPFAERLITLARKKGLARYRLVIARLGDEDAAKKLFDEIAPLYDERPGGYTRILKLSEKRLGDKGAQAILELVGYDVEGKAVKEEPLPEKAPSKPKDKKAKAKRKKTSKRAKEGKEEAKAAEETQAPEETQGQAPEEAQGAASEEVPDEEKESAPESAGEEKKE
jgi:large subunit ribosomal protein L17